MQISSYNIAHSALAPLSSVLSPARDNLQPQDKAHDLVQPVENIGRSADLENTTTHSSEPDELTGGDNGDESQAESAQQAKKAAQERQEVLDQQTIKDLAARDREVRAHEQAHMAVGGQYAGSASYTYERGPNGVNYAIGGEVPISTGKEATPEQTLRKAQIIRRAALAPAEPSPTDRQVAAQATRMESEAKQEIASARLRDTEEKEQARASAADEAQKSSADEAQNSAEAAADQTDEASTQTPITSNSSPGLSSRAATALKTYISSPQSGTLLNQVA